ncbi:histidine phosphatase family protein [Lactobacillus terrae]|uniref:histidine phosphatase family protein n=1 Tax=Lactobacillus terrae TaxID=2269374 RepID=UPI000C1B6AF9|nr:histidine phosphatase family protein [Lactobacillus terrae]
MSKYEIYFIRHGKTVFNTFKKMQGWSDTPLTEAGVLVAEKAALALKDIKFDIALSSDTTRAMSTCRIILQQNVNKDKLKQDTIKEFREEFYGYFEGMNSDEAWLMAGQPHDVFSFPEINEKYGLDASKNFMKEADPSHMAENAEEYWARIDKGFEKLDKIAKDGDKILLVSHGTTIQSLADKYKKEDFNTFTGPRNASLSRMVRDNGVNVMETYNEILG